MLASHFVNNFSLHQLLKMTNRAKIDFTSKNFCSVLEWHYKEGGQHFWSIFTVRWFQNDINQLNGTNARCKYANICSHCVTKQALNSFFWLAEIFHLLVTKLGKIAVRFVTTFFQFSRTDFSSNISQMQRKSLAIFF